ncbi:hypothetical protein QZH56_10450 [Streptomyces olivoreticuli]|uniref:hypothetical protein n=1 Tax=Streptomyces olivoreticuli TaxID=68246 RepID=UPI00265ADFB8|nr:hypothetical protein [Streptomyces olivoreticuli]WKK25972.1 hypothetical protein QZH56_10450 [Streptomyces olivoreticuli]
MLKHVSAPARFFSQVPNEIIRHPRLSSDAVRLLTWQLSLPDGVDQRLSKTAEQAGIKKTAFTRAKRELAAEGYFHEWRGQGAGGLWRTRQLVSNVPLTEEQALAVRDGVTPPSDARPAVGGPSRPAVGRSQEENTGENTSHPLAERGARALVAVCHAERRLRLSGRDVKELAPLAGEWLSRGATLQEMRQELTDGLPDRVHSPVGILRDRLTRKMPEPAPEPAPRPNPLRACGGGCGRVIRPVADETECRDCRLETAGSDASGAVAATRRGMSAVRASLEAYVQARPAG